MTNSAAMLAADIGRAMSRRKRSGPAPSMRAASTSSSGMAVNTWRNSSVAVAEAISGSHRPVKLPTVVDQADIRHHGIGGDDPHLHRQHQRDEDQPEGGVAKRE